MSLAAALPHGPITPVVDGVYAVRSAFQMGPGMRISRTMTIVKVGVELVVMNAARLSPEGEAELDKLGRVAHLVKLSDSHGLDEPYYVDRYTPEVWKLEASKGQRVTGTRRLGPDAPIPGARVLAFSGTSGWAECALWIPNGGGTLVATDALQNHVDTEGSSTLVRLLTPMMGFKGGVIVASMWRRKQKVRGEAVRSTFAELVRLDFANLVTGHGPPVVGGADQVVRRAVELAAR